MAITLKKVVIALACVALVGLLMFAGLIALLIRGDETAKANATALCGSITVGMPADVALDRAIKAQGGTQKPHWFGAEDGAEELVVAFPAWLPLTGYDCWVSAKDGRVTETHITTVD
jgi:hypothetical protein